MSFADIVFICLSFLSATLTTVDLRVFIDINFIYLFIKRSEAAIPPIIRLTASFVCSSSPSSSFVLRINRAERTPRIIFEPFSNHRSVRVERERALTHFLIFFFFLFTSRLRGE